MSKTSDHVTVTNGSVGFCSLLIIAFIVLKLCGVISWSWWWILSPIWVPIAVILNICLVLITMMILLD